MRRAASVPTTSAVLVVGEIVDTSAIAHLQTRVAGNGTMTQRADAARVADVSTRSAIEVVRHEADAPDRALRQALTAGRHAHAIRASGARFTDIPAGAAILIVGPRAHTSAPTLLKPRVTLHRAVA